MIKDHLNKLIGLLILHRTHILSVDVDDIIIACADYYQEDVPHDYVSKIDAQVRCTLDALREYDCKATFFVQAQYCRDIDSVMKEIVSQGHVVASHGVRHRNVGRISIQQFREEIERSIELLSNYQHEILGYRAPAFSMPYDDDHFGVLLDNGIKYVSNGAGIVRSNVPSVQTPIELDCGLMHVPVSTKHFLGGLIRYPIGYGVVARYVPETLFILSLKYWLQKYSYFHYYFHPYELSGTPRNIGIPYRNIRALAQTQILSLRSNNRHGLFKKVFNACRFEPIESLVGYRADCQ